MNSVAQKSKPLPNDQNVLNRIKPVNEIIFIRQIKVSIEHYILSVSIKCSMRDLLLDVSNYAWPANGLYASDTVNDFNAFSGISSL